MIYTNIVSIEEGVLVSPLGGAAVSFIQTAIEIIIHLQLDRNGKDTVVSSPHRASCQFIRNGL